MKLTPQACNYGVLVRPLAHPDLEMFGRLINVSAGMLVIDLDHAPAKHSGVAIRLRDEWIIGAVRRAVGCGQRFKVSVELLGYHPSTEQLRGVVRMGLSDRLRSAARQLIA